MGTNFPTEDDAFFYAKLKDAVRLCLKRGFPCFVGFLNEHQVSLAKAYLKKEQQSNFSFFCGYQNGERAILGVCANQEGIMDYMFPLSPLTFSFKKEYALSHRDFLGALMGMGLKREAIGDILVESGRAVIFVKDEVKAFILTQIEKIGSVGVTISEDYIEPLPQPYSFKELTCTVASMRLDNIVSAVTGQSREKSSKLIKSGMVAVNAVVLDSVSREIKTGDKIAVRRKGKFIVSDMHGLTKKGRQKLTIKEYR